MNNNYYMQVHMRLYKNGQHYESFAINAEEGCWKFESELTITHHEVITDPARIHSKIFQIDLKFLDSGSYALLHIPIHESTEWEIIKATDIYTIGFYCILGEQGRKTLNNQ